MSTKLESSQNGREVWECAVSWSFLQEFCSKREDELKGLTIQDVVTQVIIPETVDRKCRYVDLLPPQYVSAPTYFVSHIWRAKFLDLVAIIKTFLTNKSTSNYIYLWIDIFAVCMHPTENQSTDLQSLHLAINNATSGTVVCLDEDGIIFKRVWCLYEIWHTVQVDPKKLFVISNLDPFSLRDRFQKINVRLAEATVVADRDKIIQSIEETITLDQMNQTIKKSLVGSAKREYSSTKTAASCQKYALMLECQKKYDKSVIYHGKAIKLIESQNNSVDIGASYAFLGNVLDELENYEEALPLLMKTLNIIESNFTTITTEQSVTVLHAVGHVISKSRHYLEQETIQLQCVNLIENLVMKYNNLLWNLNKIAREMHNLGYYSEAFVLFKVLLKIQEQVFGTEHLETISYMDNFGQLLISMGKYNEALSIFEQSLNAHKKLLGSKHSKTIKSMNNLATALFSIGKYDEALPLFKHILDICGNLLDVNITVPMNNLALTFLNTANYNEALSLFNQTLSSQEQLLGVEHPSTVISMSNLALTFLHMNNYEEALPLFQKALRITEKLYGTEHAKTALTIHNMAVTIASMGKYSEALPLLKKALNIHERLLGSDHLDTATLMHSLADTLYYMGNYSEAKLLFKQSLNIREKLFGIEHPNTRSFREYFVKILGKMRRSTEIPEHLNIDLTNVICEKKILGKGTYGTVYFGKWQNYSVAIKILTNQKDPNLLRELQVLSSVHHINITKYFGSFIQDNDTMLVMEYVPHGSLAKWIEQQSINIPTQRICSILKGIASGMDYLHSSKITHRDLKSLNILVTPRNFCLTYKLGHQFVVKICDFGLAKLTTLSNNNSVTDIIGTIPWAAPEYLDGRRISSRNEKGDIFSFGVIAWELVTSKKPWTDQLYTPLDIIELVKGGSRLEIPEGSIFQDLIVSCWDDSKLML